MKPSNLYAVTQEHDMNSTSDYLIIFEIKASQQRSSTEECKIFGKIKLNQGNHSSEFSLVSLKGFVLTMGQQGAVRVFKTIDLNDMIEEHISYKHNPFNNLNNETFSTTEVLQQKKSLGIMNRDIYETPSAQGSFVMIRNPQNLAQIILFEYLKISEKEGPGFLESYDMRLVLAVVSVLLFFLWKS